MAIECASIFAAAIDHWCICDILNYVANNDGRAVASTAKVTHFYRTFYTLSLSVCLQIYFDKCVSLGDKFFSMITRAE